MSNEHKPGTSETHHHHVAPLDMYYKVFGGLIFLTILTVATSYYNFGVMNMVIAMAIAVTKASLVILFFMQLKFDDIGNKVTFAAAFAFLTIFIMLTGSDLFFRKHQEALKMETVADSGSTGGGNSDQNVLRAATPQLVEKGKELYKNNACFTCHGDTGKGDGIAAGALNPKPRDFTSGYWKFGGSPTRVFKTITVGSPGTAMAPYAHLSVADRYALTHYIRSFYSPQPGDTPEDLKAAGLAGGGDGAAGAAAADKPKPSIPIEMAMAKMEVPDQVIIPEGGEKYPQSPGAKTYRNNCMSCHGVNGVGAKSMTMGLNPEVNLITKSWVGSKSNWVDSSSSFENIVVNGLPGRGMPGQGNLSQQEINDLHAYAKELTRH